MRCLKLSSLFFFLLFFSCAAPYKSLQPAVMQHPSALRFKPVFDKALYRCTVDGKFVFKKFHLSGLLFFKTMEDKSTRAVFQNEMGFSFFDFEWSAHDSFKVHRIIEKLNKPALIKTLQKDMSLLLMKNMDSATEKIFLKNNETYHRFDLEKGWAYYITKNDKLVRIENGGKNKVVTITPDEKRSMNALPAFVFFEHHKANFTIQLTEIDNHADE